MHVNSGKCCANGHVVSVYGYMAAACSVTFPMNSCTIVATLTANDVVAQTVPNAATIKRSGVGLCRCSQAKQDSYGLAQVFASSSRPKRTVQGQSGCGTPPAVGTRRISDPIHSPELRHDEVQMCMPAMCMCVSSNRHDDDPPLGQGLHKLQQAVPSLRWTELIKITSMHSVDVFRAYCVSALSLTTL